MSPTSQQPQYLFRVYSDSSNGINSATAFAPASAKDIGSAEFLARTFSAAMREELEVAILGKKTAIYNPFVFFTPSFLLALQFAHYRHSLGENNIRITCFNVDDARTPSGDRVRFRCVEDMMQECNIQKFNKGKEEPRSYRAEYATLDYVNIGNARTASFEELMKGGLYKLYPTIKLANSVRRHPKVNMELNMIREMYFLKSPKAWKCDAASIEVAAKLAAMFKPNDRGDDRIAEHLLAWFLSLQKRDAAGLKVITGWLKLNSYPRMIVEDHDSDFALAIDDTTMPEVSQFHEIWQEMRNHAISDRFLSSQAKIRPQSIDDETKKWQAYKRVSDEERKKKREGGGGGGKSRKPRRATQDRPRLGYGKDHSGYDPLDRVRDGRIKTRRTRK